MQSLQDETWLAVRGKSADAVCSDLGLRPGMSVTRPRRFTLEGAQSDAGWYLILADGFNHRLIQPPVLTTLSAGCEVLTCTVDERNLCSVATGWANGRQLWSVKYEGEDHPGEVVAEGELPPRYEFIHKDYVARSQADDAGDLLLDPLFEIPIETVRDAIGYRRDEPSPAFDGRYVVLDVINPTIMQRLFGG